MSIEIVGNLGKSPWKIRILKHLGDHCKKVDRVVAPFSVTQDGIAHHLGVSRGHVAIELKRLTDDGLIHFMGLRYIKDNNDRTLRRRRKTYRLSDNGFMVYADLHDKKVVF